jgi:hypothetical protein
MKKRTLAQLLDKWNEATCPWRLRNAHAHKRNERLATAIAKHLEQLGYRYGVDWIEDSSGTRRPLRLDPELMTADPAGVSSDYIPDLCQAAEQLVRLQQVAADSILTMSDAEVAEELTAFADNGPTVGDIIAQQLVAHSKPCNCGSGKPSYWVHDTRGTPLRRVCEDCMAKR